MKANDSEREGADEIVSVSDWNACYNSGDEIIVLSCTVRAARGGATITGVGLILNSAEGMTRASSYVELSGGCESLSPSLNLPPQGLAIGHTVSAVLSGEAQGEHFFFQQELTIGNC